MRSRMKKGSSSDTQLNVNVKLDQTLKNIIEASNVNLPETELIMLNNGGKNTPQPQLWHKIPRSSNLIEDNTLQFLGEREKQQLNQTQINAYAYP